MDDRCQVGVVKIKGVGGDAIQQSSACHVHPLASTQNRGLSGGVKQLHGCKGSLSRCVPGGTDRAAQPVVKGSVSFLVNRFAPCARGGLRDKSGK